MERRITSIAFPLDLYRRLTLLARARDSEVGTIVREAVRQYLGEPSPEELAFLASARSSKDAEAEERD